MSSDFHALDALLGEVVERGGSDLHIGTSGSLVRIYGVLQDTFLPCPSAESIAAWVDEHLSSRQRKSLDDYGDADFAFSVDGERFRASVFRERGQLTIAIRHLASRIPTFDEIVLPDVVREWHGRQNGLVIVCGPTGSGKSTTVASVVNEINQTMPSHILTIEDPVEYVLPPAQATVRQREIGEDAVDFPRAIRAALREDIDVLVIGEMRDLETIAAAITVAETGHLVFATLHTSSASQAVDRIIDAFQPDEQPLIRSRLAAALVGVVYQRLLPTMDGRRAAAFEVLVANHAVRNLIREGKTHQIPNMMTTGVGFGMQTMESALEVLVAKHIITDRQATLFKAQNVS